MAAGLDRPPQTAFRLAQIEAGLLLGALRQAIDRAIVITDAAVEAELKAEEKERYRPQLGSCGTSSSACPAGATEATRAGSRARMEDIRRRSCWRGADFDDLAWRESDSQTRFRGGAMGYVPAGVLQPRRGPGGRSASRRAS